MRWRYWAPQLSQASTRAFSAAERLLLCGMRPEEICEEIALALASTVDWEPYCVWHSEQYWEKKSCP